MGLLFREHPKAQPEGGFRFHSFFFFFFFFSWARPVLYEVVFCGFVVPGAPEGSTGRRFPLIEFFGTYTMFKILIQPDVETSYLSKILLLYGAKTNKTLV